MNIHALQGYEAISEAQELMSVAQQIVTPQSGSVIIGLVQDSLVGAWLLTKQDAFFDLGEASDLLMALEYKAPDADGLHGYDESVYGDPNGGPCGVSGGGPAGSAAAAGFFNPTTKLGLPAVLKSPRGPLWTGKQIFSCLLPLTVSIIKNAKATLDDLTGPNGLVIKDGALLAGRLNKSYLGAANTGVVQAIWRLYGAAGAHKFISDAQRLLVKTLCHAGPSISIVDCLVDQLGPSGDSETLAVLSKQLARSDAVLGLDLRPEVKEAKSSSILQETLRSVGALALAKVRQDSALACCVNSGSKGNVMNIAQIAGCVGQQTIYGRRVPQRQTRLGPRTLVYYAPGDNRAEARGFVANSYVTGLTPAEFFEHQMAGREGIVATAVNTSESGYNQRRMIKGQESQCIGYDGTVRVSSNIIIQTSYGGDDLDGSRLERVRLPWLKDALAAAAAAGGPRGDALDGGPYRGAYFQVPGVRKSLEYAWRYAAWRANLYREIDLTFPCAVNVAGSSTGAAREATGAAGGADGLATLHRLGRECLKLHARHHSAAKAPLNISSATFVLQCAKALSDGTSLDPDALLALYAKALVAAGEGVGALGASSIGEPSMQMTLNTFHYTGIAAKNVTITGLPRFRQIINGVDTYETANMTAELVSFEASAAALQISRVMLSDVMARDGISAATLVSAPSAFALFKGRGPFAAKFAASEPPTGISGTTAASCVSFTILLDATLCAQRNIKSPQVVQSLRDSFGVDAIVTGRPHWALGAASPTIVVTLAPWIAHAAFQPIAEALVAHHQVRGIDSVRNSIVQQETTWPVFGRSGATLGRSALAPPAAAARSRHVLETEGSNVLDLAKCAFVRPETIRTNNIVEASSVLGIAAGITVLQSELHKVLAFDSACIDPRHTWLLADTMGRSGSLAAMNRHHMSSLGSSLLQEASFEQSLDVFEKGATFGRSDPLAGATERIITGQPVCIGTGLMGLVSTDAGSLGANAAQVLVAPMALGAGGAAGHSGSGPCGPADDPLETIHVRPLNFRGSDTREFDPSCFAQRLADAERVAVEPFLEICATAFRTTAASRRLVPKLRLRSRLTEQAYRAALTACWAYGPQWTSMDSTALVTEVHWTWPASGPTVTAHSPERFKGLTVIRGALASGLNMRGAAGGATTSATGAAGSRASYAIETFAADTSGRMACDIFLEQPLEATEMPFGVESSRVVMRQQSYFCKGAFALTLAREWTAKTNTECEDLVLKAKGSPLAILETIEPETVLQNRCTDAQLGNALYGRLPI